MNILKDKYDEWDFSHPALELPSSITTYMEFLEKYEEREAQKEVNMKNYKVYLAGPITGLDYGGAVNWREQVKQELAKSGIVGISPMRAKEYFKDITEFSPTCKGYEQYSCLSSARGIMTRDHWDATRCDIILVNLLGAEKVSIGTVMEVAWAWDHNIPVVVAIEDKDNPHEHGMITEAMGFRVNTLNDAIEVIKGICLE